MHKKQLIVCAFPVVLGALFGVLVGYTFCGLIMRLAKAVVNA